MKDVWMVLFPYKTGIFENFNSLEYIMETTGLKYVKKVRSEVFAREYIREHYSLETLFLMGIDNTNDMRKNNMFCIPANYIGNYRETEVEKEEEWEEDGKM